MWKLITFFVLSAGLIYLSRRSLRVPRSHGFYRFFAAEYVLALVLLNVDHWFVWPLTTYQIVAWLLLIISLVIVLAAVFLLKSVGKPDEQRSSDVPLAGFEKTTSLVTHGIYKYIRHPMYASAFYGTWGVYFKDPSWLGFVLAVGSTGLWLVTARIEEVECIGFFGDRYRDYMRRSRMFVPFVF